MNKLGMSCYQTGGFTRRPQDVLQRIRSHLNKATYSGITTHDSGSRSPIVTLSPRPIPPTTCAFSSTGSHRPTSRDIVFREATADDFDGIRNLSRIAFKEAEYKQDYLMGWLPIVLQDPHRLACIGVRPDDGRVMVFVMGHFGVDGGRTMLGEAARVDPDAEGSGLMGRCLAWLFAHGVQRWPALERGRSSSVITQYFDTTDKVVIKARKLYIEAHIGGETLRNLPRSLSASPFRMETNKLSGADFQELLSDKQIVSSLYPEGVIGVSYNLFDPLPSNVPYITKFHPDILVGKDRRSVSISGRVPCDDGRSWRHSFNYSGKQDVHTFMTHLSDHLKIYYSQSAGRSEPTVEHTMWECQPSTYNDIYLVVCVPQSFKHFFQINAMRMAIQELCDISDSDLVFRDQYQYEYV